MLVLKSNYDAVVQRAKTSGRALSEMTGELIDGMTELGFDPKPKHMMDTTAKRVIAALRDLLAERDAARIERDTAQRERDGYREDALKHRANVKHLIPGGPKAKAKRDALAAGVH